MPCPRFLAAAVLLLLPLPAAVPGDDPLPTGELFRYAPTGAAYRVLRDPATGDKLFERVGDGVRRGSLADAVAAEEALLTPLRRRVHLDLWPAVEDAGRAAEPVRVVLVLADQPIRAAAAAARGEVRAAVEQRISRIRETVGALGPLRAEDPDRRLQLGDRLEEEARLLSPEAREELRTLRGEILALLQGMRRDALEAAAGPAAAARRPVEEALARVPRARVVGRSTVLCSVFAEIPAGALPGLLDDLPQVVRVLPHGTRRTGLDVSVPTVGASSWTGAGYDGSSSTMVAILDTGIDSAHPALSSVVGPGAVFLDEGEKNPLFQDDADSTDDIHGHGTHVGGIVMSTDATNGGVAPGGVLINAKCGYLLVHDGNNYGSLEDADIMAAADWAAGQGADAANGSFGGPGTTDGSSGLSLFFDACVDDLGIFTAIASGNEGPDSGSCLIPGDSFNVLTTGSLADKGTTTHTDNTISGFSGRGPLDDGRRKPDLCAPGTAITSCYAHWEETNPDFVAFNGTSMATPHVAGAAALLLDYAASWRPEGVKALLLGTTRNSSPYPTTPDDDWGTGAMDLAAAFTSRASVAEGTLAVAGNPFAFVRSGPLLSGERATLCWNREALENGSAVPTTYRSPADLDLFVYEEADDSARGSSTGALDNVEQVALTSSSTFPILKVRLVDGFPTGQTEVHWAVATEATMASTVVAPPALRCAFTSIPGLVRRGEEFPVEVAVANDGELPASWPVVTLDLPEGYEVIEGENPATLVTIPIGEVGVASWTVRAPSEGFGGEEIFDVAAVTDSFGETFQGEGDAYEQILDTVSPFGFLTVAGGREAVNDPVVTLQVLWFDDRSTVEEMGLRNEGGSSWSWQPYAFTLPWTLAAGEGIRTVEARLVDSAGNESETFTDSVLVDLTAPTGAVSVNGGAPYALPWEPLFGDASWEDAEGGAGVTAFRHRWNGGAWSMEAAIGESPLPLDRPDLDGPALLEVEFLDGAGNGSPPAPDGIELVHEAPRLLNAVKKWSGVLDPGGDVDGFRIGLLPGDLLTVRVKAKPAVKKGEVVPVLDLVDPEHTLVVDGRWPAGARKPGIVKFEAASPGDHWLLLRADGADAAEGASVALTVKVKRVRSRRKVRGEQAAVERVVTIPFEGITGSRLKGRLGGRVTGMPTLLRPDESEVPLALQSKGKGWVVPETFLGGGTGTYYLRVPSRGTLTFNLTVRPPKTGKVVEAE